jgi:hypothetical protein
MKYTLICEDTFEGKTEWKNTVEFEADFIYDVVDNFELFLKGCGFHPDNVKEVFSGEESDFLENVDMSDELEQNNSSEDVMKFVVESLSTWPKNFQVDSEECPKCKIPLNIIYRHGCVDSTCKHNT